MQKHKLPSTSTSRAEQKQAAEPPMHIHPSSSSAPLVTKFEPTAAVASSAFDAALLNLPDLSARKELAFKKANLKPVGRVNSNARGGQAEASSSPPTSASSARHSSLSAQLNGPLAALEGVTASLRSRGKDLNPEELNWKGSVKNLTVGRCLSTSSSSLSAYADRLSYKFHSSSGSSIAMLMYYKDMDPSTVELNKTTLSFHISTPLIQFSSTDYSHADPSSLLSFSFFSIQDARDFAQAARAYLPL